MPTSLSDTDNGYNSSMPASPLLPLPTNLSEATCYYVVLGLKKSDSPSQDEIKKAYKRMALRYHPDKNSNDGEDQKKLAEKLFKLVARAYEVLSSANLKATYDRHGHRGISAMNGNEDQSSTRSSSRASAFGGGSNASGMGGFGFGSDPFGSNMFGFGAMPQAGAQRAGRQSAFTDDEVPMFAFHDPFDIFRQVFGAMNMMNGMHMGGGGMRGGMPQQRSTRQSNDRGMEDLYYYDDSMDGLYRDSNRSGTSNRAYQQPSSRHPTNESLFGNSRPQQQQQRNPRQMAMMDPFGFGAFGPMGMGMGPMGMGMGDMMGMHQQMMMGGFGPGMGGGTSTSMSFSSSGGRGGTVSTSTSTTTRIVNGQQVTRTIRRTTDANGHTTEDVHESIGAPSSNMSGGRLGW